MKVIAFNGSPRKEGNTYHALNMVGEELKSAGIEFEIVQIGSKAIRGCMACNMCAKNRDEKCVLPGDEVNDAIQLIKEADGVIFGSPVHYSAMGGTMKCFMDRVFYTAGMNGNLFRHKVGASVVAVRRSGGIPTFSMMNNYINYAEMIMPASNYWNVIHGTKPGECHEDAEGVQIMKTLGKNMVYTLNINNQDTVETPEKERKDYQ